VPCKSAGLPQLLACCSVADFPLLHSVRQASVLVIDEGTSALDSSSEALLMERIAEEQRELGMTVILIAHRLSTVRSADKIIVMGKGHVLEQGTHQSLEAAHGEYWKMLRSSFSCLSSGSATHPSS
jgi:ABC-type multidrug transport system fused ATPase/permease subunit